MQEREREKERDSLYMYVEAISIFLTNSSKATFLGYNFYLGKALSNWFGSSSSNTKQVLLFNNKRPMLYNYFL